jgi:hypothetical protein
MAAHHLTISSVLGAGSGSSEGCTIGVALRLAATALRNASRPPRLDGAFAAKLRRAVFLRAWAAFPRAIARTLRFAMIVPP